MAASGEEVQVGVFGGWIDVGVLDGGWTWESGGGRVRGGCIDELVYLVSVGVECVCVKGSLVLVLVLGWTQCLPQGVGAPPAMCGDARPASPKNWVTGPPERRGKWIQFAQCSPRQSPRLWHCGTPTTSRLYPFGARGAHLTLYQRISLTS